MAELVNFWVRIRIDGKKLVFGFGGHQENTL
jgi:hypothetical protein